ncbi:MAG: metal-dependent phosphoesterase [Tannerellaceae bacterium]
MTTREEAHCLALFGSDPARAAFQEYLETYLPPIPNDPERFGDQVWVDRHNEIMGEVPSLLISALPRSVNQIALKVHQLGGLFMAAHVDRPSYSLISQLGFIDPALPLDGIEYADAARYSRLLTGGHAYLSAYTTYTASDAHYPNQIGTHPSLWLALAPTFENLRMAYAHVQDHQLTPYE